MKKIVLSLLLIISFCILLSVSGCEVVGGTVVIGTGHRHKHIYPAHHWRSSHHTVIYRAYPHYHWHGRDRWHR